MRGLGFAAAWLMVVPALVACGSADEARNGEIPPALTGTGGTGGGGASTAQGGNPQTTATTGTGGSAPEVCPDADGVYKVQPAQTNLLFLVDRSGSMHVRVGSSGSTRWTLTEAGLVELFGELPASTVGGLELFPTGDKPITCCKINAANNVECSCTTVPDPTIRCNANEYHKLPVPMAALDMAQIDKMTTVLHTVDKEFYWGTPLAPAVRGAVESLAMGKAAGVSSVVLLTDGQPTSCDTKADPGANDIQRAVDAAATGEANGIRTYVMGVYDTANGADPTYLSKLAHAGGTDRYSGCDKKQDCAYPVTVKNFTKDLSAALQAIALEAMTCSFDVPSVMGGKPDYDKVNITITSGGSTITVPHDASHADGWDYLPNNKQVQLYGSACAKLKGDAKAEVEVVVGCKTLGN